VSAELVAAAPLAARGDIVGRNSTSTADVRELLRRMADAIRRGTPNRLINAPPEQGERAKRP
jgi:hypothetical protein